MSTTKRHLAHLVPSVMREKYGAGNWKDIAVRVKQLKKIGLTVTTLWFDVTDPVTRIKDIPEDVTDVLIEYTLWLEILQAIRATRPDIKIHVRAHNAEGLQHFHRSNLSFLPTLNNFRNFYGCIRLTWRDRQVAILSDTVFGISAWDRKHYWIRIAPKANHIDLPYICPWPMIRPEVTPRDWPNRERRIICMPGGGDRLSRQQRLNFERLAKDLLPFTMRCELSGGIIEEEGNSNTDSAVIRIGNVEEPWDLLCSSMCIAILTDQGFGMKTTIIDGLRAGCHVLVHKGLACRLPTQIRNACIFVDPSQYDVNSIVTLLSLPPENTLKVSEELSSESLSALSKVFGYTGLS